MNLEQQQWRWRDGGSKVSQLLKISAGCASGLYALTRYNWAEPV